ncbi:hypothetical protein BJY00DRAFT_313152 [Aspergillus carlsbadensis]|nr:hypothetical protein BJY00DRAFT_313152 [Aspergillus carlsbadensis]
MLEWLVRRVPKGITLFFLVDDVGHFEGNSFSQEGGDDALLRFLQTILRLAADTQLACVVKLLVTSADFTDSVAEYFEHEGLVVDFGSLDEGDGLAECDIGNFEESDGERDACAPFVEHGTMQASSAARIRRSSAFGRWQKARQQMGGGGTIIDYERCNSDHAEDRQT